MWTNSHDEPGGEAGEADALDVGDGAGAADGREVALVAVVEGLAAALPLSAALDAPSRRSLPPWIAGWATPGQGWTPPLAVEIWTMSPMAKTSGWPGSVRCGCTVMRPARSTSTSVARGLGQRARPAARPARPRPRPSCARGSCARRRRSLTCTVSPSMWSTRPSSSTVTPRRFERARRLVGELRHVRRQHAVAALDEDHLRLARVDGAEVAAEGVVGDLGELAGELDAGRPGADDHEGQPLARAPPGRARARRPRRRGACAGGCAARARWSSCRAPRTPSRRGRSRSAARPRRRSACRRGSRRAPRGWPGGAAGRARRSRSKPDDLGHHHAGVALALEDRRAAATRCRPATASRSPPGRAAAGRGGSCAGRRG